MPFTSPGVFVQEVPSSLKTIAGVGTSTAAFIGIFGDSVTLVAPDSKKTPPAVPSKFVTSVVPTAANTPKEITNWTEFVDAFGDMVGKEDDDDATEATAPDAGHRNLAQAVFGFFANGGTRCFVIRVKTSSDVAAALTTLESNDDIAVLCAPGQVDNATREALLGNCENRQDRFAVLDGPGPEPADLTKLPKTTDGGLAPRNSTYGAWYYPWIKVFDPAEKLLHPDGDGSIAVPPSGHVAGVYARVDAERGVFKSPGNEVVRTALSVMHTLSNAQQGPLNTAGVNAIRAMNGNILLWGARTIGGNANTDLKYIATRRTLLFLRESIQQGAQWAVFEPNTPDLWAKIIRNVTAFLTAQWRAGALFGTTPQQAFFVKCDAENNPDSERDLGNVNTDVGVAIVRPAEFVIFRISQQAATK